MDAVAFPPPPAPFLDEDLDFGDFTFASAPAAPQPPTAFAAFDDDWGDFVASGLGSDADAGASAPTAAAPSSSSSASWEKPRGPLPLSLFGADDDDGQEEEEGPAGPPPTATAPQRAPSFPSNGPSPADLKDLIAGLYGSQPPPAADAVPVPVPQVEAEDDQGFGDDDWEFTAATAEPADQDGGGPGHADGIGKIEDITKSLSTDQEDWSSFTSVDDKLNHVHQTTDVVGTCTEEFLKASTYLPANNSAILNLYKESERADAIHIAQSSAESVQSSSDLFSNNEMNSSFETDDNHSSRSTRDCILIEFYHRMREESLTAISRHVKELREAQKESTFSDENNKATAIGRDIQEIHDKLKDSSLPKGFFTEEQPWKDVYITELLKCTKEEHLKDFEQEYCLAEKIERALEDTDIAVELYKLSVSTLHILKLASKEEQGDYVGAWYSMLLSCAQELQHGAALWQEFYHANVRDRVVSEGGHYFIALGEIYRVAQILCFSMQCFKPWVLADPGMLSKMLVCLDRCINAWTSGLEMALKRVVDSNHLDASVAKPLLESINNINELEVPSLQNFLPTNKTTCRLSLLPPSSVPGMKLIMWNGNHYIVKVANLWANWISSYPPQMSRTPVIEEQRSNTWQSY